jgi:hypothetical protein
MSSLRGPRIDKDELLKAGLALMAQNGKPLAKRASRGTAKLYSLPNGESVRVRTCNDHILITVADHPGEGARLNIEGTDWILLIVPEVPRTPGAIHAYLLPTDEVVQEVREAHGRWLDSQPNTAGDNTTWNIRLDDRGPAYLNGYAQKWARYLLQGEMRTDTTSKAATAVEGERHSAASLRDEIRLAREHIARVAGVSEDAVRITIDFGA